MEVPKPNPVRYATLALIHGNNRMDTRLNYQNIIKSVLQNHADYRATLPDGYTCQVLFDDERGQYLIIDIGWDGVRFAHAAGLSISPRNTDSSQLDW